MRKMNKQSFSKLAIKQETIRHLRDSDLHVMGGAQTASIDVGGCFTKRVSCTSLYVHCAVGKEP